MSGLSSWWAQADRIHIAGSFGEVALTVAPEPFALALDDAFPQLPVSLFEGGNRDPHDLQYLLFAKVGRTHAGNVAPKFELDVLQVVDRVLSENFDLRESNFCVAAQQVSGRRVNLPSHLLDERGGEFVEISPGVVGIHRVVSLAARLAYRSRAAARSQIVDDLLAADVARRLAPEPRSAA